MRALARPLPGGARALIRHGGRSRAGGRTNGRPRALTTAHDYPDIAARCVDFREAPDFTRDDVPLEIYPDVVSEEEEAAVLADIESQLSRRPYEAAHWDSVIDQYREIERPFPRLPPSALAVAERMMAFFEDQERIVPAVHFLDLAADGEIRHHVDSVKFSGPHIVILSLLSPALLHLQHQHSDAQVLLYAPRRSVYVMRDASRYDWSHAVLKGSYTFRPFPGGGLEDVRTVDRQRRISFIMRDLPPGEEVPTRSGTGAM